MTNSQKNEFTVLSNQRSATKAGNGFWRKTMKHENPIKNFRASQSFLKPLSLLTVLFALAACDSVENRQAQVESDATLVVQTSELDTTSRNFGSTLWENVLVKYCKDCHYKDNTSGVPWIADPNLSTSYRAVRDGRDSNSNPFADVNAASDAGAIYTKVAGGHNCWVINNAIDCATAAAEIVLQIDAWKTLNAGTAAPPAESANPADRLSAPNDYTPRSIKTYGDLTGDGYTQFTAAGGIYELVTNAATANCSQCHSDNAATPQAPFFAQIEADGSKSTAAMNKAFEEITSTQKIDLNAADTSRMYVRLSQDSHQCWTNCAADATTMLTSILLWSNNTGTQDFVETGLVVSKALSLDQGQITSGGIRYEQDIIAKYEFKTGSSDIAYDSSGIEPAMNLSLRGNYEWVGGYGVQFKAGGRAQANSNQAQKLHDLILPTREFTLEAWVIPASTSENDDPFAPIASYSFGPDNKNFGFGQYLDTYAFANRSDNASTSLDGSPVYATPEGDSVLQATQQHVVVTYHPVDGRKIYVNGKEETADFTNNGVPPAVETLIGWNRNATLVLGAETDGSKQWLGRIRLFAIHNKALTLDEANTNYKAGVGQKFNLLFRIGHLDDTVDATTQAVTDEGNLPSSSYIWFLVSEYDNSSYLFSDPKFVILDPTNANQALVTSDGLTPATYSLTTPVAIEELRLGINGKEAEVGQVFGNLSGILSKSGENLIPLTSYDFDGLNGIDTTEDGIETFPATANSTVIAKINGPNGIAADQFYISMRILGGLTRDPNTYPASTNATLTYDYANHPLDATLSTTETHSIGFRKFNEINATMAALTGVSQTVVAAKFADLQQKLANSEDPNGYLSPMQMATVNLADSYCKALVNDGPLRTAMFPGFTFLPIPTPAELAAAPAQIDIIIDSLVAKMVMHNASNTANTLAMQPLLADIKKELYNPSGDPYADDDLRGITQGTVNLPGNPIGLFERLNKHCTPSPNAISGYCTSPTRTLDIIKSMCISVMSSAAVTVQ